MTALIRVLPNLMNTAQKMTLNILQRTAGFHSLTADALSPLKPGGLFDLSTRTVIRNHFPRPSETKRIKRHGWKKRMSTASGRRVLMNRILKGRWVYSH